MLIAPTHLSLPLLISLHDFDVTLVDTVLGAPVWNPASDLQRDLLQMLFDLSGGDWRGFCLCWLSQHSIFGGGGGRSSSGTSRPTICDLAAP